MRTLYPNGTIIYTPFPDYELTDPPGSGADTVRTTYRLGGQIVAVQTKVGATAGAFYFIYTDHLGNIAALGQGSGVVAGSLARFDPFGNYRTTPNTTVNPAISSLLYAGGGAVISRGIQEEAGRNLAPGQIAGSGNYGRPDNQSPRACCPAAGREREFR